MRDNEDEPQPGEWYYSPTEEDRYYFGFWTLGVAYMSDTYGIRERVDSGRLLGVLVARVDQKYYVTRQHGLTTLETDVGPFETLEEAQSVCLAMLRMGVGLAAAPKEGAHA